MLQIQTAKPQVLFRKAKSALVSRSAMYFAGFVLQRCANLLLIPLLVLRFTPADFARYGLMQSVLQLAPAIVTLRVHTSIGRLIYDTKLFDRSTLLASSLLGGVIPMTIVCAIWCCIVGAFGINDPITEGSLPIAISLAVILISRIVTEYASILFRAIGDGPRFLVTTVVDGMSFAIFCGLALLPTTSTYASVIHAMALASAVTVVICLAITKKEIGVWRFDLRTVQACVNYAWPTAIHLVGMWFCVQSSRWIGAAQLGLEAMGSFTLIMLFVSVLNILTRTVFEAQRPTIGKMFAEENYRQGTKVLRNCRRNALILAVVSCVLLSIVYILVTPFLPKSYEVTWTMLALISLFVIVDTFSLNSTNALLSLKKPKSLMISSLSGGAVSLLVASPLCKFFEVPGLCLALVIGAVVQAAIASLLADRVIAKHELNAGNKIVDPQPVADM